MDIYMKELEKRFIELDFIKPYEKVRSITDYSKNCSWKPENSDEYHGWSGQVLWWLIDLNLENGNRRYIMKCPWDTFGSGIEYFVDNRVELSRKLMEAGVNVPIIKKYDKGTMVHEYVEGMELGKAVKKYPEKKELYESKRNEIVSKIKDMGYTLLTEDTDSNYIVTPRDEVFLIDLDLTKK